MINFALSIYRLLKAIVRSWDQPEFRATLALAGFTLFSGTMFYRHVEDWTWIDSLYFSVTTISTVGFGDLTPQTDYGKLFTVLYIFVGVGIFVALVSQFAKTMILYNEKPDDRP